MQNLHGSAFHLAEGLMVIDASGAQIDRTAMLAFRDSTRQAFAGFGQLPGHRIGLLLADCWQHPLLLPPCVMCAA